MLDRLFGAADAEMADEPVDAEDAVECMDGNGKQMESFDLAPHIPRKRCRSPSPAPSLVWLEITAHNGTGAHNRYATQSRYQ
ncbi:hypothetical protein PYCCODRAFT_1468930 [Trametes coccinea BRFM310]|uniref:Uncharacterized protein n=1 Tax=Trametes coccinea (strain BRFM310) TaxID=1353009 RepID=A0A1Y2IIK0_TRAC3|nr:hypothetical protein PYCCODRAFT_1468930 [Trametes coccinea BRFM310]